MKHSIKRIFWHLKFYLLFIFFAAVLSLALLFEHELSFNKIDNLMNQKKIIASLTKLKKDDIELALIQFNGKSTQLLQEIEKLRTLYKYNITERYLLRNEHEYMQDLDILVQLTKNFNKAASQYYTEKKQTKEQELQAKKNLTQAFNRINKYIDTIIFKDISYNQTKFSIIKMIAIALFIFIFLATLFYRKLIDKIYDDIEFLFQVDKKDGHEIFSMEADAIALRMNRKTTVQDNNPNNIDQVTGINNYRGMLNAYAAKKGLKSSNFTSVTVFEIDNFSKTNRVFPQEVAQAILKKIAYTISLHEQPVDVIARTDYNQFTVILSRASKEQTFKDAELIRESISELKFNLADKGQVKITVSGGHIIKPNNTNLEEALKQAKEILAYAKATGKNRILQIRDLAQKEIDA